MWHRQIENFGFAIIPNVLPADEIAQLVAALSTMESRRTRAGVRHALKFPSVARVAHDPRVAMRPLIIHASSKSKSQNPRRVLHIEYAVSLQVDGLELATT